MTAVEAKTYHLQGRLLEVCNCKIDGVTRCELEPFRGPTGKPTTLNDSAFSTIPGSPAFVGKAAVHKRTTAAYGLADIDLSGHNAIQGTFRFDS